LSKPNTKSKIQILNLENQPIRLPMMCEYNQDIQSLELLHYQKPDDYIFFFKVTTNSNSFDPLEFHFVIKKSKDQMKEIFDDLDNNRICLFNDHDKIQVIVAFHSDKIFLKSWSLYKLTLFKNMDQLHKGR
jgi:hypothetical protein